MRKAALLTLLTIAIALPTLADEERHQSYLSYEEGGTVVKSGENGDEIQAHRNLPVYPGDEVVTARRGRAEVRLSDGNIIGIDRATALRFRSILDSYEGDDNETIAELKYGKVALHRTDIGRDHVRLDTDNASYVAENEAVYSVETDARGRDRVTVFDGSIEVRTPNRTTRLRQGDSANVDDRGAYDVIGDQRSSADDFERWFLNRAERFGSYNSRYMDRRLSYWNDDLDDHGRWVFVTGIGWSWRPYVAVGWRPYYNGYWYSRNNCMTWVSYDPWGWGPYHYGRWAYDPGYGWIWVPGYGYSPAWVYWTFGSGFVGWAPAGWWDCYRPYYNWAYQPYRGYSARLGFGFYGRMRLNDLDMRPWTFIDSRNVISNRVDRAALTADAVKQRLGRSRDGFVTVAGQGAARFTREEWNDPAEAIRRRSVSDRMGRNTGAESGAPPTDVTPFFRRDGDVSGSVRERIARGAGRGTTTGGSTSSVAPIGGGSVAPIGRGSVAPVGRGSSAPVGSGDSGRVSRGGSGATTPAPAETPDDAPSWRDRVGRRGAEGTGTDTGSGAVDTTPSTGTSRGSTDTWRRRVPREGSGSSSGTTSTPGDTSASPAPAPSSGGSSDVPRRVIDRIGGARVYPRDSGRESTGSSGGSNSGSTDRGSGRSTTRDSGSSSGSRGDRGSSSSGGSVSRDRGSSSGSGSNSSGRSSSPPPASHNDGGSRKSDEGSGHVKRD
ncbi:MAG TPA: DUF6600 domain-containing protein [Thermoanaerobaculia bacterium]|nr:DUF6600 domain-containing protein [Thermoanaerobaculia bacterium]